MRFAETFRAFNTIPNDSASLGTRPGSVVVSAMTPPLPFGVCDRHRAVLYNFNNIVALMYMSESLTLPRSVQPATLPHIMPFA